MTRFSQVQKEWGVDDELPTPWVMVPSGGFNVVMLNDDANLSVVPENKQLINVFDIPASQPLASKNSLSKLRARGGSPETMQVIAGLISFATLGSSRIFVVTGESVGDTIIKAKDGRGVEKARLNVSVKRRRTVKVAFNFVKHIDASGKEVNHTSNDPSVAGQWIDGLNNTFTPQTNVMFEKYAARWVTYKGTLDRIVRPEDMDKLFKERDPKAEMNIFIVGELEMDSNRHSTADITQGVTINYQNIVCEDNIPKGIVGTMAHEALHFLLHEDHHKYAKEKTHWLMEQESFRTGYKIPKEQANKMNPTQSTTGPGQRK